MSWKLNPSRTGSVVPLTVSSGAAHTYSLAVFLSAVSRVGTKPSISTPVVDVTDDDSVQTHVVMPEFTPTQGERQPPFPSDPFTAITPGRV